MDGVEDTYSLAATEYGLTLTAAQEQQLANGGVSVGEFRQRLRVMDEIRWPRSERNYQFYKAFHEMIPVTRWIRFRLWLRRILHRS